MEKGRGGGREMLGRRHEGEGGGSGRELLGMTQRKDRNEGCGGIGWFAQVMRGAMIDLRVIWIPRAVT